jgi:chitodextrinase
VLTKSTSVIYDRVSIKLVAGIFIAAVLASSFTFFKQNVSAAACTAPSADYGTATIGASVPGSATYRVWTRMYIPNSSDSTYLLEIDGNTCLNVGGSGVATGSWTWVSHQNGNLASKTDVTLASGNHNLKLIGNKPGVKIDRIVLTSDLACVPTGFGDNCNEPTDTTAPTVKISSPLSGASVSGSTVNVTATATDNLAVSRVEFYVNGVIMGTDTSSPYAVTWDSSKVANGDHQLSARGYDAAGNSSSDGITVKVTNGDTIAPTAPTGVLAQATAYNNVRLTWSASSDNVGVTGYRVYRGGVPIATLGAVTSFDDNTVSASTSYSYKVEAFDAAGNRSALSASASVTTPGAPVVDTQAPSQPMNVSATAASESQINLSWAASTDNVGVVRYDIFRGSGSDAPRVGTSTTTSYGDTGLAAGTAYTYQIAAVDAAGNVSVRSGSVSATTKTAPPEAELGHSVTGRVTNSRGSGVSGARISVSSGDGTVSIVQANKTGYYAVHDLKDGSYTLSVEKRGYATTQLTLVMNGANQIRNITLSKR